MIIPAAPILSLVIEFIYGIDMLSLFTQLPEGQNLLTSLNSSRIYFAAALSIIFFVFYVLIPYLIFWLIFLPIFYKFLLSTKLTQMLLELIHKYLNENILAAIMGISAVILAGL